MHIFLYWRVLWALKSLFWYSIVILKLQKACSKSSTKSFKHSNVEFESVAAATCSLFGDVNLLNVYPFKFCYCFYINLPMYWLIDSPPDFQFSLCDYYWLSGLSELSSHLASCNHPLSHISRLNRLFTPVKNTYRHNLFP